MKNGSTTTEGQLLPVEELIGRAMAERDAKLNTALVVGDLPSPLPRNVFSLAHDRTAAGERRILSLNLTVLAQEIAAGDFTSEAVFRAYAARAVLAQQLTNCLTDFDFEGGLARAIELDEILRTTGRPVGPLHGVPISIKDHINVEGRVSSSGVLAWALEGKKAEADGVSVRILREAGAVIYCKTTLPQTIMHLETSCYLGPTLNPFSLENTPGGSSGGEGALIALHGSAAGIGSDIGGSLRCPAAYCGLWTLKPTTTRFPVSGSRGTMLGTELMTGIAGPMTRSFRDLDLIMHVISQARPWLLEPALVPIPWAPHRPLPPKLRVGFYVSDGVVTPQPPIRRAMDAALEALRSRSDVELVPYEPFRHAEANALIHRLYFPDGGKRMRDLAALSGEPILPLSEWVLAQGDKETYDVPGLWEMTNLRNGFRASYAAHWQASGVDVVLCPVGPHTAPKLGETLGWSGTNIWNLVDYPATAFPTGLVVDSTLDSRAADFVPLNTIDARINAQFDPEHSAGLPIGLQVVGFRHEDALVMEATRLIATAMGVE